MNEFALENIGLDNKGYILKDVSKENISAPWKSVVEDSIKRIKEILPYNLHSIYIYGSVGRGTAVEEKSNLDLTVVTKDDIGSFEKKEVKCMIKEVSNKYNVIRDLSINCGSFEEVMHNKNHYYWGFWLKTCCDCIYGEDLGRLFPRFKPSKKIGKAINGDFANWLTRYKGLFAKALEEQEAKQYCKEIMKKVVRTSFSLVIHREKCWTSDIDYSSHLFLKYYPDKKEDILKAMDYIKNPICKSDEVIGILNSYGEWLKVEVEKVLN